MDSIARGWRKPISLLEYFWNSLKYPVWGQTLVFDSCVWLVAWTFLLSWYQRAYLSLLVLHSYRGWKVFLVLVGASWRADDGRLYHEMSEQISLAWRDQWHRWVCSCLVDRLMFWFRDEVWDSVPRNAPQIEELRKSVSCDGDNQSMPGIWGRA